MARGRRQLRTDMARPETDSPPIGASPGGSVAGGSMELDRLIHERVRLAIVSALAANQSLSFTELRDLIGVTDGNLSVHARKLEDAGYVHCDKGFEGRMPRSEYSLTLSGRKALERYLDHMEGIIKAARAR